MLFSVVKEGLVFIKYVLIGFAQQSNKLEFVEMLRKTFPLGGNVINLRNQGPISLSLRTSPQTGVAIRSPCSVPISNMLPRRKRIATSLRSSQ